MCTSVCARGEILRFQQDLKVGKEAEGRILSVIKKKYPLSFAIEGCHKAYDIFIPEIDSCVEVKNDLQAKETGNIFIEISWRGEPSGLMATRAEYWAYCINDKCIWVIPKRIKDLIIETGMELRTFVPKNESGIVQGYLIPIDVVERYSCIT